MDSWAHWTPNMQSIHIIYSLIWWYFFQHILCARSYVCGNERLPQTLLPRSLQSNGAEGITKWCNDIREVSSRRFISLGQRSLLTKLKTLNLAQHSGHWTHSERYIYELEKTSICLFYSCSLDWGSPRSPLFSPILSLGIALDLQISRWLLGWASSGSLASH